MNRDLFWKLLEAEHPKARAFCRRLAANKDDGDDLYQDALVRAYSRLDKLRDNGSFRPWLYRIIVNKYKSNCRRFKWFSTNGTRDKSLHEAAYDPSGRLNAGIWLDRLFKAISVEERILIVMFEIEGWSIDELAEMYGKPSGTIKSKLSRTRKKMRRELDKYLSEKQEEKSILEADYGLPRSKTSLE